MINIVTILDTDVKVIRDCESFFKVNVLSSDFTELDTYVLKAIDNAEILDRKTGCIKTPFGITDIFHLSTGCKVVLTYLYMVRNKEEYKDAILNVTECGRNALETLFDCVEKLNDNETVFFLGHTNKLRDCSDRDFSIDGTRCACLSKGVVLYGKGI